MKALRISVVCILACLVTASTFAANRYWVGTSTYTNNFNGTDLSQWALTDDNGTGSWSITGYGSAILMMDNLAGGFANRLFNVNGGFNNLLPLDKVNGTVNLQVLALTGLGQRFFVQVQEYNLFGTLLNQQTILAPTTTAGTYTVNLSSVTWNAATTQVRFILGGDNLSARQGTIEFNYFTYTTSANNWNNPANWSLLSGGLGGASVPGSADMAFFDAGSSSPSYLTGAVTVLGLSMSGYTGTIDLRGFNLTSTGTNTFASGNVANTAVTGSLIFNTVNTTTFSGTSFNAIVSGSSGGLVFNGSYFGNAVSLTKTGTSNNIGLGGNVFQGAVALTNNASGTWRFANISPDVFNGTLSLTVGTIASASIDLSYTATNNQFNDDVTVTYNTPGTITFGGLGGTSNLATGKTISVAACSGNCGSLSLAGVATGNTAQSIVFPTAGTGSFRTALASVWNGNLTVTAATVLLDGATFNGITLITKTGTSVDVSNGGNAFNNFTSIINSGTGTLRMAGNTGDAFNGNVVFSRFAGVLEPAYNGSNSFASDISINSSSSIALGAGSGFVSFTGSNTQTLIRIGSSAPPVISRLMMNKSGGKLLLTSALTVGTSANFTSGIIDAPAPFFISIDDGATVSNASDASHVDGIVKKTGNSSFTFPVGDAGVYRPITITNPVLASVFSAQFFKTPQLFGNAKVGTLTGISNCEYWILDRESGLGIPFVTLSWRSVQCNVSGYVSDPVDLRVGHWNGSFWDDYGRSGSTGNAAAGTVTTLLSVLSFSPFALASATPDNPLPVTLEKFKGVPTGEGNTLFWETATERNNDYFSVLRSSNGVDFEEIGMREGAGTTDQRQYYNFLDKAPFAGVTYYKLRQTDFDKQVKFSEVIAVSQGSELTEDEFYVYPNPADKQWINFNHPTAYRVVNALGREVLQGEVARGFDSATLPAGMYWVVPAVGQGVRLVIR